jgi:hypothetical protein
MDKNYGVHAAHCCRWHGCKYGDKDCPVVSGEVEQLYPCMFCDDLLKREDYFRQALEDIEEIKAFKEKLKKQSV